MKKNKSYILIISLIAVLIFGVAASCQLCGQQKSVSSTDIPTAIVTTNTGDTAAQATTTKKSDPNLIHGVLPTKVTAHGSFTISGANSNVNVEFWNVGKLGGDQYSKVTGTMIPNAGDPITFDGSFTGGPNGDLNITATYNNNAIEWNFKLKDGKEIDLFGNPITVDNPEAFKGWTD